MYGPDPTILNQQRLHAVVHECTCTGPRPAETSVFEAGFAAAADMPFSRMAAIIAFRKVPLSINIIYG